MSGAKQARRVLGDCKFVLSKIERVTDPQEFRVLWAAGITLLRTVGDVLHKVDVRNQPELRLPVEKLWTEWKEGQGADGIFFGFIKRERDEIVHRYEASFYDEETIMVLAKFDDSEELFDLDTDLFRPLQTGYGQGEDCREVFREAVEWWDEKLNNLAVIAS